MSIPDYILIIKDLIPKINSEQDPSRFTAEIRELEKRLRQFVGGEEFEFFRGSSTGDISGNISRSLTEIGDKIYLIVLKNPDSQDVIASQRKEVAEITQKLQAIVLQSEHIFPYLKDFQQYMKLAAVDGESISLSIDMYNLPTEEMRARVAIAAAGQNPDAVLKYLKNYKISNPQILFLIATALLENIEKLSPENAIIVLGMIDHLLPLVNQNTEALNNLSSLLTKLPPALKNTEGYQKCIGNIVLQMITNKLFIQYNSNFVEHLLSYQIKDEDVLFKIIIETISSSNAVNKIAQGYAENLYQLGLKRPEYFHELCVVIAKQPEEFFIYRFIKSLANLKEFGLNELEINSLIRDVYSIVPNIFLDYIRLFPISEKVRFEITCNAIKNANRIPVNFNSLEIKDINFHFQIVEMMLVTKSYLFNYKSYFFGLESDQKRLHALAEMLKKSNPDFLALILFNLGIKDSKILRGYALSSAKEHPNSLKMGLGESNENDEKLLFDILLLLGEQGELNIPSINRFIQNPQKKVELANILISKDPEAALYGLTELGLMLDQNSFFSTVLQLLKNPLFTPRVKIKDLEKFLTPGQFYILVIKAIELWPGSMQDQLLKIQFDDAQKKLNCLAFLFKKLGFKKLGNAYSKAPPKMTEFLEADPSLMKCVPYIKFAERSVDLGKAKIDPAQAPNKTLGKLLQVIQKLVSNLPEGDQGHEKMLEWLLYFDLRFRGSKIPEDKLAATLPILIQIVELRIPLLRYYFADLLSKHIYSPTPSSRQAYERIGKLLNSDHTQLFRLMLTSLYEANPDKDWNFIEILNDKSYLHFQKHNTVIAAIKALEDESSGILSSEEKFNILRAVLTCSPKSIAGLKKEGSRLDDRAISIEIINQQLVLLASTLSTPGIASLLKGVRDAEALKGIIMTSLSEFTKDIPDFDKKYSNLIKDLPSQKKYFLALYSRCFSKYEPAHQEPFKRCFKAFLENLLEGNYKKYRYSPSALEDKNWAKASEGRPGFVNEWQKGEEISCKKMMQEIEDDQIIKALAQCTQDKTFDGFAFLPFVVAGKLEQEKLDKAIGELKAEQSKLAQIKSADPKAPRATETKEFMRVKLQIALLELLSNKTKGKRPLLDSVVSLYNNIKTAESSTKLFLDQIEKLKSTIGNKADDKLTVVDTDDWMHMLSMGTDTKSCQSIYGHTDGRWHNRALLSYLIDPSNRMIAIVDENQQIQARAIMRLMIDPKSGKPVLYIEDDHKQASAPSNATDIILKMALNRAKKLNIPLFVASEYLLSSSNFFSEDGSLSFEFHKEALTYLGGRSPFHNVDTAHLGTIDRNAFEFPEGTAKYLLWDPSQAEKEQKAEKEA